MLWSSAAPHAPGRRPKRRALAGLLALGLAAGLVGCKKKEEQPEQVPPPPPGGADVEIVSTKIGRGLGLDTHLAPTGTQWDRVLVLDEERAVIAGHSLDQAIALRTDDGGRTWVALKAEAKKTARWGAATDGTVALALGQHRKGATKAAPTPIESMQLFFAEPSATELSGPVTLFPNDGPLKGATIGRGSARPAVWSGPKAGALVTIGGRKPALAYAAPAGRELPDKTATLTAERFVSVPYGRPPSLLSVRSGSLMVRPWPEPGEDLVPGTPIPKFRAVGDLHRQLSEGPSCESGPWSFQAVRLGPTRSVLVGVSPNRALAVPLPPGQLTLLGCSEHGVVLQTVDPKTKNPQLVRCTLDGQCAQPGSPPFGYWTEKHERIIAATTTKQGVVAIMTARAGARWGMYLGQSQDGGKLFELPQVVGEAASDRGLLKLGALVSLPKRVLLLISADVTGTTRRGWYVLASDDGGAHWGPP